jgi:hypothetical protein
VNAASQRTAGSMLPLTEKQLISLSMQRIGMLGSVSRNSGGTIAGTQNAPPAAQRRHITKTEDSARRNRVAVAPPIYADRMVLMSVNGASNRIAGSM